MKRILIALVSLTVLCTVAHSATVSGSWTNGALSLLTAGAQITQIQVTDTAGAANQVFFYDNASGTTNTVYPAHYTYTSYSTNLVTTITNMAGTLQTNTNTFIYTSWVTNAATTNTSRLVYSTTVPASGTVTFTPLNTLFTTFGLSMANYSTGLTYTITYYPLR